MKSLKWRAKAAVVGYLDVVLALIGIIGTIVSAVAIAVHAHKIQAAILQPAEALRVAKLAKENPVVINETETSSVPKSPVTGDFTVSLTVIWVAVGVAAVLTALQLVSAVRMLKATEVNYDRRKAIGPSKCWLYINAVLILASAPSYILILGTIGTTGYFAGLFFRGIMFYVVYHFTQELVQTTTVAVTNKNNGRIGPIY